MRALWRGKGRRGISSGGGSRSALAGIDGNTLAMSVLVLFGGRMLNLLYRNPANTLPARTFARPCPRSGPLLELCAALV